MAKRSRKSKSRRPCPCARTCKKRKGSPRFPLRCRAELKSCMAGEVQSGKSFKSAGRTCMTALHQCATRTGATTGRPRRRRRAA